MRLNTSYATIMVFAAACSMEPELVTVFTVQSGNHYSTPRMQETLQQNHLEFEAMFDESCVYDLGDAALQTNKNKLLGFSDCNSVHHENSARFAWQWTGKDLEIYAYCYAGGVREEQFIGTVSPGVYNRYRIEITGNTYRFRLNDGEPVEMHRGPTCNTGMYYLLWPYFGGSIPAPHDINIYIKRSY